MIRRICHWILIALLMQNSIGIAVAGVSMYSGSSDTTHVGTHSSTHADKQSNMHANTHEADKSAPCDEDCCKGQTTCQCLCMHNVQAMAALTLAPMRHIEQVDVPARVNLGHAPPPPGEYLRPPIL